MTASKQVVEISPVREDLELGPGWEEEIVRRIRATERDESRLIPGAEVAERVRKALRLP